MQASETNVTPTPTPAAEPPELTTEQLQQRFTAMKAEAKRELKKLSKNQLVRTVIAQLIEIHQMREALKEASAALEQSTPAKTQEAAQ